MAMGEMEAEPEDGNEDEAGGGDPAGFQTGIADTVPQIAQSFSQHEAYARGGRIVIAVCRSGRD